MILGGLDKFFDANFKSVYSFFCSTSSFCDEMYYIFCDICHFCYNLNNITFLFQIFRFIPLTINLLTSMPRTCRNHSDTFCYVCGSFTASMQRRKITNELMKIYKLYFGCSLGDQGKSWAPHIICTSCSSGLRDWLHKRKTSFPFAIPMIWREPKDHVTDCYF